MSGLEIAGVLLGAFPLIISGLEHWHNVAKVGGCLLRVRMEFKACLREVQFHHLLYQGNLKALLLPIANDADEVARLISDPGGKGWSDKALQERLEKRLQESYKVYMELIGEMNETAVELKKELVLENTDVQNKLALPEPRKERRPTSPQPTGKPSKRASAKTKWDFEKFRIKFSFTEVVRKELFDQLKKCNKQLEQLLSTSDKISALEAIVPDNKKRTITLETAFKKAWNKADLLFKAIHQAWQCSCQQYHFANLRLEHCILSDKCFEVILMSIAPSLQMTTPWSWKEFQCETKADHSCPQKIATPAIVPQSCHNHDQPGDRLTSTLSKASVKRKQVAFTLPILTVSGTEPNTLVDPNVKLCQLLGHEGHGRCMGMISHEDETYHLHPITKRRRPDDSRLLTLNHALSRGSTERLTRRQRYSIALLIASSVAQLRSTPWLNAGLTKEDVLFSCVTNDSGVSNHELFVRQGFPPQQTESSNTVMTDCDFSWLGILLLELCFGQRLEDHPIRTTKPTAAGEIKQFIDRVAAQEWSQDVHDEAGGDYASAVRWCFLPSANGASESWRVGIIKNVINPLEKCQDHFRTAAS